MPTVYPRHMFGISEAVDVDDVNENLQEIVATMQGNLGEQNWSKGTFDVTRIRDNALGRVHFSYSECARTFDSKTSETRNGYHQLPGYEGYNWEKKVPVNRQWTTMSSQTITTRDCMVWLIASWQQDYIVKGGFRDPDFPGVQYCLAVDGSRIAESTIGGMDRANDRRGEANAVWKHPFATDAFIKLPAGEHIISLEARMVATPDFRTYSSGHEHYIVATRELIAVEIT